MTAVMENREEAKKNEAWSPLRLLEIWGLRSIGRAFTDPTREAENGVLTSDDELQAVDYVERTPGFSRARPALRELHIRFRNDFSDFVLCQPGETVLSALVRLDWTLYLYQPFQLSSLEQLPRRAYDAFFDALIERAKTDPFIPIREMEELDANEIGEQKAAELQAEIDRRWA